MLINEIFVSRQGEGLKFLSEYGVFVRLSGCNLQCGVCDTKYHNRLFMDLNPGDVEYLIKALLEANSIELIILTGGEPLVQHEDLNILINNLVGWQKDKFKEKVLVETNGTINITDNIKEWKKVNWSISPKLNYNRKTEFCSFGALDKVEYEKLTSAESLTIKMLITKEVLIMDMDHGIISNFFVKVANSVSRDDIVLQPCWYENKSFEWNLNFIKKIAERYREYKVIPQMHKILGWK
jgi:organic radical activating enzyme